MPELSEQPGLYQIRCLKNNKIYIGQSTNRFN